jgi:hypothetical protein
MRSEPGRRERALFGCEARRQGQRNGGVLDGEKGECSGCTEQSGGTVASDLTEPTAALTEVVGSHAQPVGGVSCRQGHDGEQDELADGIGRHRVIA